VLHISLSFLGKMLGKYMYSIPNRRFLKINVITTVITIIKNILKSALKELKQIRIAYKYL
jgi:hypothetical protein